MLVVTIVSKEFVAMNMEEIQSSETLVTTYKTAQRHNLQNHNP
jgi:hypothetical protein